LESTSLYLARFDLRAAAFQAEPDFEGAHPDVDGLRLPFRDIALSLSFGFLRLSKTVQFTLLQNRTGFKPAPTGIHPEGSNYSDVVATGRPPTMPLVTAI
jgi:hypothetical protein